MAPRLAATQGRPAGAGLQGPAATKHNPAQHNQTSQQIAAQQQQQQQQPSGAGGGAAPSAGGQQGVPALLLSKGYDVLGVIGEVSRQPVLHLCRSG